MTNFDARRELEKTWKGIFGRLNELEARESNRFRTAVATASVSPYDINPETDGTIFVDTSAVAITLNLPTAVGDAGRVFYIKDIAANASSNNITIQAGTGEAVDGVGSYVISADYGAIRVQSDGVNWYLWS